MPTALASLDCGCRSQATILASSVLLMTLVAFPAAAQVAAATPAQTGPATSVSGTVYDSVAHEPLGGARVQFVDAATRARQFMVDADSLGRFHIDSIPAGLYIAGFFHPSIDVLGVESPLRAVKLEAGRTNVVDLNISGPSHILTALCGDQKAADSTGAMAGVVRDAKTRLPIADVSVVVTWLEVLYQKGTLASQQRTVTARTDANGGYRVCGLPGADTLFANAEMAERRSGLLNVPIPAGGILRRDFTLGDSASATEVVLDSTAGAAVRRATTVLHGSSSLVGVVHGPDTKPLEGASIAVPGTGLETKTNGDGRFALSGLPAGTFSVEARAIGLEPKLMATDLLPGASTSIDIELNKRVQLLSRVTIVGKVPRHWLDLDEFLKRKQSGLGHYFTQDDPMLKHAFSISNVVRMVPGVKVVPSGRFGHIIVMHGQCAAAIYVDGTKLNPGFESIDDIPPDDIAGIEVYSGALEVPPKFQSDLGCGVIAIWSKR